MNRKRSFMRSMALSITVVFVLLQSAGIILFLHPIQKGEGNIFFIVVYEALLLAVILLIINSFKRRFDNIIKRLSGSLLEFQKGNFSVTIHDAGYIETAMLRDSVSSMLDRFKRLFSDRSEELRHLTSMIKKSCLSLDSLSEDIKKQGARIKRLEDIAGNSGGYRRELVNNAQGLITLTEDNVSALTEVSSSGGEIEEHTKELSRATAGIHSVILEISDAVKGIAKNMEDLSVSVEQTSVAVDELTASFKEIERSTKESANMTEGVRSIAAEGMGVIADAMDGMDEIAQSVNKNVEMIQKLAEKSGEIEKILAAISDITKKTNLLSLNAAILSSQAGEEGKVFSVVADEIKVLADKTRSSAKEITEIINSTREDIETALNVTGESLKAVERGTGLVIKAGESLREVINLARQSAESAITIQKATHEQVTGISQINRSMEMIKNAVEDVTKATFMQEKGSRNILSDSERIKEISSNLMRGIEEQNKAVQMMLENLQVATEKMRYIREIAGHEEAEGEIKATIEDIRAISERIIKGIKELKGSFNRIHRETIRFTEGLEGFRGE